MECTFSEMRQEFFEDADRQFKNGYARGFSDALLKHKVPMRPTWNQGKAYCSKCFQRFPMKRNDEEINYCSCCGQAVK